MWTAAAPSGLESLSQPAPATTSAGLSSAGMFGPSITGASAGRRPPAPMRPVCVGELMAHSDAVTKLLPVSPFTLVAGGSDGLVSLWKDGLVQAQHRNEVMQQLLERWLPASVPETWA